MSDFENEKNCSNAPLRARKIKSTAMHKDVSADFVLPDYMGDIKRVLKYTATVVPCNKLVSADEASFLAIVTFRITYLDGDDTLTEAVFSSDAEFFEKLGGSVSDAEADYKVKNVAVRLGGPRKINAKALVQCDAYVLEEYEICGCSKYDGAEMLKKEIKIHNAEYLKCAEREYAEQIDRLDELSADDVEVVKSFAKAFIDETHKTEGGVNLSGYIDAFCVIRTENGIQRLEKRIPVEEHIECNLYDDSAYLPGAYVTGVNVNLNNINSNDECALSVVMAVTVECTLVHHYNESLTVVKDAFYQGCKNECSYETIEYSSLGDVIFDKVPMSAKFDRGEQELHDIIESEMTLGNLRFELDGGEITVLADGEIHLIARGNSAEDCYVIKEPVEFSKRYRLNTTNNMKININAVPCEALISIDSEKIYLDAQVIISIVSEKCESEEILSNLYGERESENGERSVLVYYPEKDDTLWSVSKKYSVSPSDISLRNQITDNDLGELSKIVIVKQ